MSITFTIAYIRRCTESLLRNARIHKDSYSTLYLASHRPFIHSNGVDSIKGENSLPRASGRSI